MNPLYKKIRRYVRMNRTLSLYVGLLMVGIFALFIGFIPSIQKLVLLVAEVNTLQKEVDLIQKKATMLFTIDRDELQKNAQDVLLALPTDKDVTSMMSTIDALASKNGLIVQNLSIEGIGSIASGSAKQATKPEGNSLSESVVLRGDLVNLRNFLAEVVIVRRLIRIKQIELAAVPKSMQMDMKLTIEAFYAPLPSSIGKASDILEPYTVKELSTLETITGYRVAYASSIEQVLKETGEQTAITEAPKTPVLTDPFAQTNVKKQVVTTPTPTTPRTTLAPSL